MDKLNYIINEYQGKSLDKENWVKMMKMHIYYLLQEVQESQKGFK